MSTSEEPIPRHARGRRPYFFEDAATDKLLAIVLELTQELSVLRDHVDTMKCVLEQNGVMQADELELFELDEDAEAARRKNRDEYVRRVFRVLRNEEDSFSAEESETYTRTVEDELATAR